MAGTTVGSVSIDLEARIAKFETDFGRAARIAEQRMEAIRRTVETQMSRASNAIERFASNLARDILPAASFGAVIAGLGSIVKQAIEVGDQMNKMSQRTGIGVEALSGLAYAADLADVSLEELNKGLGKFAKNAADAAAGAKGPAAAFNAIGVSATDAKGKVKPLDDLLGEVADKFASYADGTEKLALAQELFGKGGAAMIPLLNQGRAALEAARKEAKELGYDFSTIAAQSEEFNDNLTRMGKAAVGVGINIAQNLLPSLIETEERVLRAIKAMRENGAVQAFADSIATVVRNLDALVVYFGTRFAISTMISGFASLAKAAEGAGIAIAVLRGGMALLGGPAGIIALAAAGLFTYSNASLAARDGTNQLIEAEQDLHRASEQTIRDAYEKALATRNAMSAQIAESQAVLDAGESQAGVWEQVKQAFGDSIDFASGKQPLGRLGHQQKAIDDLRANIAKLDKELDGAHDRLIALLDPKGPDKPPAPLVGAADAAEKAKEALKSLDDMLRKSEASLGPLSRAQQAYEQGMADLAVAVDKAREAKVKEALITEKVDEVQASLNERVEQAIRLTLKHADVIGDVTRKLSDQNALAGLDERARFVAQAVQEATTAFERLSEEEQALHPQWEQEIEDLKAVAAHYYELGKAAENARALQVEMQKAVVDGLDNALRATADFVGRGFSNFKSFWRSVVGGFKQMFLEIAILIARQRFVIPFAANILGVSPQSLGGVAGAGADTSGGFIGAMQSIVNPSAYAAYTSGPPGPGGATAGSAYSPSLSSIGGVSGMLGSVPHFFGTGGALSSGGSGLMSGAGAGAALGFIGGAYTAYQGIRQGNVAQGAIGGAMAGTAILPGWGTLIGLVVGALAAYLHGPPTPPTIQAAGANEHLSRVENTTTTPFGLVQANTIGEGQVASAKVLEWIKEFDTAVSGAVSTFANATEQTDVITQALKNWTVDLEGSAATAEGLLGSRFNAILATFDQDVQDYVGISGKLEDRVQRLADAGFIQTEAAAGTLLETFEDLASLLDENKTAGESVQQTYERLLGATHLIDDALALMGHTLDMSRRQVIEFAGAVAEAAGGADRAAQLFADTFAAIYSPVELAQRQVATATDKLGKELGDIGLSADTTAGQFRTAFEAAFDSLSPEELVQWLEAGAAIKNASDAQTAYNQALATSVQSTAQAEAAASGYGNAVKDLTLELTALQTGWSPSAFVLGLSQIRAEEAGRIQTLNQLAIASGRAGAEESDLALIHQIAAAKAAAAIAALKAAAQSLIEQLYGANAIGTAQASVGALDSLDETAASMFESWEAAIEAIGKAIDDVLLNERLTTLTPEQQLAEAQRQFSSAQSAALGGDANAAASLPELFNTLLEKARGFWSSGDQYEAIFEGAIAAMRQVQAATGPGNPTVTDVAIDAATTEAEQAAEDIRQQREQMAIQLAQYLRDLADELGENTLVLATEMGVKLTDFVEDLGVDLNDLSVGTAEQLAQVSNLLGIELTDLTNNLGISLGALADANSYLNDALEDTIKKQPPEIAEQLEPLLAAIETATTDADANAAITALEEAVNEIGGSTAVALAPFLAGVDPPSIEDQIALLDRISATAEQYLPSIDAWLAQIAESLGAQPVGPANSYAKGSAFIPYDQVAKIHQGEKVLDARSSQILTDYGIRVQGSGAGEDVETKRLVRELMGRLTQRDMTEPRRIEALTSALNNLATVIGRRLA